MAMENLDFLNNKKKTNIGRIKTYLEYKGLSSAVTLRDNTEVNRYKVYSNTPLNEPFIIDGKLFTPSDTLNEPNFNGFIITVSKAA